MSVCPSRAFLRVAALLSLPFSASALADGTAQTLPFSQDWTDTGLITTSDDWSGVPGVMGFRGDGLTGGTGTDPQTLLADETTIDVNANQTNPNSFSTGGTAEFELADPVVALTGSGTADAPSLVLYLNTVGYSNIQVSYNVRDLDSTADNAIQQVALQYRIGATGDFSNVPSGFVADGTTASSATQVTAVAATLPADADNVAMLQVRIITANAAGNDEWVGIDDISVTGTSSGAPALSISDAELVEGDAGTSVMSFDVTLANAADAPFTVTFATVDGTATAGDDYVANADTLAFAGTDGEVQTVQVTINGDATVEDDESFTVELGSPSDAAVQIADGNGVGTIVTDDFAVAEIFAIQGSGGASPLLGSIVESQDNVVTGVGADIFTMQTPDARDDGNKLTSNGIMVFLDAAPTCLDGGIPRAVAVGDLVDVVGTVVEFFELTEFGADSVVTCTASGQALPTAVVFEIGGPDGDIPSRDSAAPYCGTIDTEQNNFECLEGMLVSIPDGIVTKGNQRFGGDPYGPVHIGPHGVRSLREPGVRFGNTIDVGENDNAGIWDGNPEILEMDADKLGAVPTGTELVGGAQFSATGVVTFSFGDYELWPTSLTVDAATNLLPRPVRTRNDDAEFTVGSFNVLRLCNTLDDQALFECDGGGSGVDGEPTQAELDAKIERLGTYIVDVMRSPDVLGLQEVETLAVLQELADWIAVERGVTYSAHLVEGNDGGGIDNGFLVKTNRVANVTVTQLQGDRTWFDPQDGGAPSPLHDRPPLLLEAEFIESAGGLPLRFAVMNNHAKSRSGVDTANTSGQRNRAKRFHQAVAIAEAVQDYQTDPAKTGAPLMLVGDYNDYQFSDGYVHIVGLASGTYDDTTSSCDVTLGDSTPEDCDIDGSNPVSPTLLNMVDVIAMGEPNEAYSYLFTENFGNVQGQARDVPTSQVLDHILLSTKIEPLAVDAAYARANTDASIEGTDVGSGPDGAGGTQLSLAVGSSDHDGLVVFIDTDCSANPGADVDSDGVCNLVDNCPGDVNSGQADTYGGPAGDACENAAPTISDVLDAAIDEDTVAGPIGFVIEDLSDTLTCADVSASSANQVLLPDANLAIGGTAPNCTVTATPVADGNGSAIITLVVSDGELQASDAFVLTVNAVEDAAVAVDDAFTILEDSVGNVFDVAANDTDADGDAIAVDGFFAAAHGEAFLSGNVITYTPDADYCGSDSFDYQLVGGSTATVTVTITCVDESPVAVDDSVTLLQDAAPLPIDVLANDTDSDGGPMEVVAVSGVVHGQVSFTATDVTYTPAAGFCGSDSFTYTLNGGSTATVSVDVTCPVPSEPEIFKDGFED